MYFTLLKCLALFVSSMVFVLAVFAQQTPVQDDALEGPQLITPLSAVATVNLDIHVRGPNDTPMRNVAVVTLFGASGEFYRQGATNDGYLRFIVAPAEYNLQVVAAAYESAVKRLDVRIAPVMTVTLELRPALIVSDTPLAGTRAALTSKAQKELGKAIDALRSDNTTKARSHLEEAQRLAPDHAEVNYVFGVFWSQLNDRAQAKSFWAKALSLYPRHLLALLSLGEILLRENNAAEALLLAHRAVEVEPSSWRARALLANAYLQQDSPDQAVQEAERALALGGDQAIAVQTLLAAASTRRGDYERATSVLQAYLKKYPADVAANEQLASLRNPAGTNLAPPQVIIPVASSLPLPSNWLPADVDNRVSPVEPHTACEVHEVVERAGERIEELVRNVDRYTATESVVHEAVNRWGVVSSSEARTFDYVASIEEVRPGLLNVDEYRHSRHSEDEFPGGVQTTGLAFLALIFHPYLADHFDMTCEGLARRNGGLAWQVHFRQRADKPNTVQSYRVGVNGPSYPVGLRGRAWITVDSYQIEEMETDLIASAPEIRLVADHSVIEYGAVHFRERDVDLWLPWSADLYYDWRGRRAHRRHSFSNFLLFSVDDKQRISPPSAMGLSGRTQSP